MEPFEILKKKVHQAAELIAALREERDRLRGELQFLEQEGSRAREVAKENEALRVEKKAAAGRIERVLKRIQSLKI